MDQPQEKTRRTILTGYGLLLVVLLTGLVPNVWFSLVALICFTAAPFMVPKRRASPDPFTDGHALYLRRTIWLSTALAGVSMAIGAAYLVMHDELSALQPCANRMMASPEADTMQMGAMVTPCVGNFLSANRGPLIISTLVAAAPPFLYLALRIWKGGRAALRREVLVKPRGLF